MLLPRLLYWTLLPVKPWPLGRGLLADHLPTDVKDVGFVIVSLIPAT